MIFMYKFLKFCVTFLISFIIMAIPVNDKPIFEYINSFAGPILGPVLKSIKDSGSAAISESMQFGDKVISVKKEREQLESQTTLPSTDSIETPSTVQEMEVSTLFKKIKGSKTLFRDEASEKNSAPAR